jgi:hypothetical protein
MSEYLGVKKIVRCYQKWDSPDPGGQPDRRDLFGRCHTRWNRSKIREKPDGGDLLDHRDTRCNVSAIREETNFQNYSGCRIRIHERPDRKYLFGRGENALKFMINPTIEILLAALE